MALRPPASLEEVRAVFREVDRQLISLRDTQLTNVTLNDLLGQPGGVAAETRGQLIVTDKHGGWVNLELDTDGYVLVADFSVLRGVKWASIAEAGLAAVGHTHAHVDLTSLQGGTTAEYYHLTASEHTELNAWLDDVTLADGGGMTLGDDLAMGNNSITNVAYVQLVAGGAIIDIRSSAPQLMFDSFVPGAVNYLYIANAWSGAAPSLTVAGSDANIDLALGSKGTGLVKSLDHFDVTGDITVSGTVDGRDLQTDGTKLDGIDASARAAHAMLDGSVHTDSVADAVSRGSLILGNSTPKWDELVLGGNTTFLLSDGTDCAWQDIDDLIADAAPDQANDYMMTYDASASIHKKVKLLHIPIDIFLDTTPRLGGNLDCNGKDLYDSTRAYVKVNDQLYVNQVMGVLTTPVSYAGLAVNPSSGTIYFGIYGGCGYSGHISSVYGLLFAGTHNQTTPAANQSAYGAYVSAENKGVADFTKSIYSYGVFVEGKNSGAQTKVTASAYAYSVFARSAKASTGNSINGDLYGYSLFVEDAAVPGGTPTSNQEWCALFEGDVQINSDKKLILEGSATSKGDTYIVWNSANSHIEFWIDGVLEGYVDGAGFNNV